MEALFEAITTELTTCFVIQTELQTQLTASLDRVEKLFSEVTLGESSTKPTYKEVVAKLNREIVTPPIQLPKKRKTRDLRPQTSRPRSMVPISYGRNLKLIDLFEEVSNKEKHVIPTTEEALQVITSLYGEPTEDTILVQYKRYYPIVTMTLKEENFEKAKKWFPLGLFGFNLF